MKLIKYMKILPLCCSSSNLIFTYAPNLKHFVRPGPGSYKTVFMLNSADQEISNVQLLIKAKIE